MHPINHMVRQSYDGIVIGSGPNGLAAAITLAQRGCSVLVLEAGPTIGGGTRTKELTLPGYQHDICSSIHTVGVSSPFFKDLPLKQYGLRWIYSIAETAHPLDGGKAVMLYRSVDETARHLDMDARAYLSLIKPIAGDFSKLTEDLLGPLPLPPRHPITMARFGLSAILPALTLTTRKFKQPEAKALFAGFSGHSIQPLENWSTAGVGLTLMAAAHANGMPMAQGGSQSIANALLKYLISLGGKVITDWQVDDLEELPKAKAYLFDTSPEGLMDICGEHLPENYRQKLAKYQYGPGIFKLDYALDGPIPWRAEQCLQAATVHVGGNQEEIAQAEREVWQGNHPEKPFILLTQTSLFDVTRAPKGKHTVWAYCHVPARSTFDMTDRIEAQIERFAPGFRNRILSKHSYNSAEMESYNSNYIGGDIVGGVQSLRQLFFRPTISLDPYRTPAKGIYLCSASTPPGGAVHGMCGYYAAMSALKHDLI